MSVRNIFGTLCLVLSLPFGVNAQSLRLADDAEAPSCIVSALDTIVVDYAGDMVTTSIMANCDYNVAVDAESSEWIRCIKEESGNLTLFVDYWYHPISERYGQINLTSTDGSTVCTVVVKQSANQSAAELEGDTKLLISSGTASQTQSGFGVNLTYDDNLSTIWHSPYTGTSFPIVLTYTLRNNPDVDYMVYTPRNDDNNNGNFGQILVEYATAEEPDNWVVVTAADLEGSASSARIDFGSNAKGVKQVRVTISNGKNNFASCAEMAFYKKNAEMAAYMEQFFKDDICSELKDDITDADVKAIQVPYFRQLVESMRAGDYSTEFRVGEFEAFRPIDDLQSELRTSNPYDRYENPTGIYFTKDETIVLFVEGLQNERASLIIKSFGPETYDGEGQPESSYPLANGMNVIKTQNRGNGYISYYTQNYETASNVKIHFAMATENGYFNPDKGHTNTDWKRLLANAKSDIFDVYSRRLHCALTLTDFKSKCPEKGVELATMYDRIVMREWEIMGLEKFDRAPKNRQFARAVATGFMFADEIGAGIVYSSVKAICNPDDFDIWGLGHELGHNNQVSPGFKWPGCGETTNNIYASWAQHKEGSGFHRLEDEKTGVESYAGWRGGRFQTYLEEGVRKGVSWQLQDGPDYYGTTPNTKTVADEDYNGNSTGSTVTTTSRNYDHFVKVVPFYQLALFGIDAGKAPDMYAEAFESFRTDYIDDALLSNGQKQVKMMKRFCDGAKLNLLPFFEKAGMFRPIDAYIEDYSPGWLKINQDMLNELKNYVESQGYPEVPAALNYINAYNLDVFRNEAKLENNTVGAGCEPGPTGYPYVDVYHSSWKNVVGFETYKADGTLLHISMYGLGAAQQSSDRTRVLFPASASYIMAVGYDGTKYKCYEK